MWHTMHATHDVVHFVSPHPAHQPACSSDAPYPAHLDYTPLHRTQCFVPLNHSDAFPVAQDAMPFEFSVLEACLSSALGVLEAEIRALEAALSPLLEALAVKVDVSQTPGWS